MRTEVHVHGYLELVEGVSRRQVEGALRPLLQYLDLEHLSELKSLESDQPGFTFSTRNYTLDICCTLEVGRNFLPSLDEAMQALGKMVENATAVEITTYHEDGEDETQLMFVGPTPEAIRDAQRRYMLEDVADLLSRHFKQDAVDEVLALVSDLFRRERNAAGNVPEAEEPEEFSALQMPESSGRNRLH